MLSYFDIYVHVSPQDRHDKEEKQLDQLIEDAEFQKDLQKKLIVGGCNELVCVEIMSCQASLSLLASDRFVMRVCASAFHQSRGDDDDEVGLNQMVRVAHASFHTSRTQVKRVDRILLVN
jgi:hypothetical protein